MGMLPIIVALLGLIFLWSVVNYNSFVSKRNVVLEALDKRKKAQVQLGSTLEKLVAFGKENSLSVDHQLLQLPDMHTIQRKDTWEELFSAVFDLLDRIESLPGWSANTKFLEIKAAYEEDKLKFQLARKRHRAAMHAYNDITRQMPAKLLAKLFGFKKAV